MDFNQGKWFLAWFKIMFILQLTPNSRGKISKTHLQLPVYAANVLLKLT